MDRRRTRGFTFIEMIVVLAIISLGTAMAIPMVEAGFDSREVRRALRVMASSMHHCRSEAVATGKQKRIRIDPLQNRIEACESRWAVLTDRAIIEHVEGGTEGSDGVVDVVFYPNGSTSGANIVVASRRDRSRNRLRLVLDPLLGSVRVGDAD